MLILSFYDFRYIIKTMHNMQMILSNAMYVIGLGDLTLNDCTENGLQQKCRRYLAVYYLH